MKNLIKKILLWSGLACLFGVIPLLFSVGSKTVQTRDNYCSDDKIVYKMEKEDIITQKVQIENTLQALSIYVANGAVQENVGEIEIFCVGEDVNIEKTVALSGITDWSEIKLSFSETTIKNQELEIKISGEKLESNSNVYFIFDNCVDGLDKARLNGEEAGGSLCMKYKTVRNLSLVVNALFVLAILFGLISLGYYLYENWKDKIKILAVCMTYLLEIIFTHFYYHTVKPQQLGNITMFYFGIVACVLLAVAGTLFGLKKKVKIQWLAAFCVFVFGVIYLLILPACSAPDEPVHYSTAYKISNQIMGQQATDEYGRTMVRKCDSTMQIQPNKVLYGELYGNMFVQPEDETLVAYEHGNPLSGSVIEHLPGAVGITIARLLHLNQGAVYVFGRMLGLLTYVVMLFWAIKYIPFGKRILFTISMFPMMLEEISSFGYDLIVCGLAFLVTAYILYLIYEKDRIQVKDLVIVSILLFVLAPCKAIYFLIAGLWFLIPKEKFADRRKKHLFGGIVFLSVIVPALITNLSRVMDIVLAGSENTYANERFYQLSDVLANIPRGVQVFVSSLMENSNFYIETTIGSLLGWFEIPISSFVITGLFVILLLEVFRDRKEYTIGCRDRICYLTICMLMVLAIIASMWFGWTPISYDCIQGVQGRYFLPILPLLCIALGDVKQIKIKSSVSLNSVLLCLLNVYAVLDVLNITFAR